MFEGNITRSYTALITNSIKFNEILLNVWWNKEEEKTHKGTFSENLLFLELHGARRAQLKQP